MRKHIRIILAALIIGSLLTGCSHLRTYHAPLAKDNVQTDQQPES